MLCTSLLVAAVLLGNVGSGRAGVIEGVSFADEVRLGDGSDPEAARLRLRSMALLRYRVVFRGYVAALYLPDDIASPRVLDETPRRLELRYFWGIGAEDFGRAADQKLEESRSAEELAALRERIDRLHAAYRDVEPGDRYALDYIPGAGTTLRLNGDPLIEIPGADFAEVYFGLWLGDDPLDEGLRDTLLQVDAAR